ncbi:hypothetical protein CesoFtcFv8_017075 [Champsocephalus esox]|uniref:Uncharacterized protein n=1 Tax=Champsocephalus esox TaxID=159716 RepID=A0AAN8BJF6_9TELE|nr:hypothetical protein CesoFtcFv8_017075 [Champsocephalus esox]
MLTHYGFRRLLQQHLVLEADIPCIVVHDGGHTKYSISDGHRVSEEEEFGYSWANGSDYVMANEADKNLELVVNNSVNDLITHRCFEVVLFKRTSKEGNGFTAECTTNCTQSAPRQSEGHNVTVPVVIAVVILLLVVLCVFLSNKFKKKVSRLIYTRVKMQRDHDVEVGITYISPVRPS